MLRISGGEARHDVDLVIGIVRPVVAELEAAGHQLDHIADGGDVEAVFRGLGAIDIQLPLDAGDGAGILHVDQAGHGFKLLAHDIGRRLQRQEVGRGQLDGDGLSGARTAILLGELDPDTRNGGGAFPDLRENGVDLAPLVPIAEFQRDRADHVFRQLLAAGAPADIGLGDAVDAAQLLMLAVDREDFSLDGFHQIVALIDRHVAAGMDLNLGALRLGLREELDAGVEAHEREDGPDQDGKAAEDDHDRMAQGAAQRDQVEPIQSARARQLLLGRKPFGLDGMQNVSVRLADQGADAGNEHHRHQQRGEQGRRKRDGQDTS